MPDGPVCSTVCQFLLLWAWFFWDLYSCRSLPVWFPLFQGLALIEGKVPWGELQQQPSLSEDPCQLVVVRGRQGRVGGFQLIFTLPFSTPSSPSQSSSLRTPVMDLSSDTRHVATNSQPQSTKTYHRLFHQLSPFHDSGRGLPCKLRLVHQQLVSDFTHCLGPSVPWPLPALSEAERLKYIHNFIGIMVVLPSWCVQTGWPTLLFNRRQDKIE